MAVVPHLATGEFVAASYLNNVADEVNGSNDSTTITTTGTQNALAIPTGVGPLVLYANNATLLTINGIAAGTFGQQLTIFSVGSGQIDIANNSGSATATARILNGVTGPLSLYAGSGRVSMWYDGSRWRVFNHAQGGWITPAYVGTDFAGLTGTWTVEAGDVMTYAYRLKDRDLTVDFGLALTTVAGVGTQLRIRIPGGYIPAKHMVNPCIVQDNNATVFSSAYVQVHPPTATNILIISLHSGAAFTNSTNLTSVYGQLTFEVT